MKGTKSNTATTKGTANRTWVQLTKPLEDTKNETSKKDSRKARYFQHTI